MSERCPNCFSPDPKRKVRRIVGRKLTTCEDSFHDEDDLFYLLDDFISDLRTEAYQAGTNGHGLDPLNYSELRDLFDKIRGAR